MLVAGVDVGDSVAVANDLDRGMQARHLECALDLGEGPADEKDQKADQDRGQDDDRDERAQKNTRSPTSHWDLLPSTMPTF